MRWQSRRDSGNAGVRYDEGGNTIEPGSSGTRFPGAGIGIVALLVIVGIALFLGVGPRAVLAGIGGAGGNDDDNRPAREHQVQTRPPASPSVASISDDTLKHFVAVVLADTEDRWAEIFRDMGRTYSPPKLVLFRGQIQSGCGLVSAQAGPFYCPTNRKIYIDLSFFDMLKQRIKASGEFVKAYFIAYEVGHHVQNSLGELQRIRNLQMAVSAAQRNALNVRMELQADCYAGVWAMNSNRVHGGIEPGDIEDALAALSAMGDDAIQMRSRGYTVPESFKHGTSGQRVHWFKKGFERGTLAACDTFADPA